MTPPPDPRAVRSVVLVVLDSVGVGGAPDAADFGDEGSATLQHVAEAVSGIELPHLGSLGLGRIAEVEGVPPAPAPSGAYGRMTQRSPGKDTTTGHWEIAGIILDKPFPTYPDGFPADVLAEFESRTGLETLGNEVASGTEIIERLGHEHVRTGRPIVYTSADSVFQIAAHDEVIPLERQYEINRIAREIMRGPHEVGRVIARPFTGAGTPENPFRRTPDRHDFSVPPPGDTVLDLVAAAGEEVRGVGKISDIFAARGVTSSRTTRSNQDGINVLLEEIEALSSGLVFANLVDFDQSFGHRNDPAGYATALQEFDRRLPEILDRLEDRDVLMITADHGNDPTTSSTDHSREQVPILVAGPPVGPADLGVRGTFADCGGTILDLLGLENTTVGSSFADALLSS